MEMSSITSCAYFIILKTWLSDFPTVALIFSFLISCGLSLFSTFNIPLQFILQTRYLYLKTDIWSCYITISKSLISILHPSSHLKRWIQLKILTLLL